MRDQTPKGLRAATAAEAVEGLKAVEELEATKEASRVSDLSRGFGRPEVWGSIAYFSMCQRTGSAIRLRILDASAELEPNGSIEICGREGHKQGIAAEFEAPSAGTYACTVRLQRAVPTWIGVYEFGIDQTVLGYLGINPQTPTNYTFAVQLGQGLHDFRVLSHGVAFWFYSLTVLQIPELAPA